MNDSKPSRPVERHARSLEDWKRFLNRTLDVHARQHRHGTVRIVFHNGEIRQVLIEQSVVDPTVDLAQADPPGA